MKKHPEIRFFLPTVVLGLVGMVLRFAMLRAGLDETGLLIPWHPSVVGLWIVVISFAAQLLPGLKNLGGNGKYRDNFPTNTVSTVLAVAGGVLMAVAVVTRRSGTVGLVLGLAAAAAMVFGGICRAKHLRPNFLYHGAVCVYFILVLLQNYRGWGDDSQRHEYVCQLMALVALMMYSVHRSCCDVNFIQRRRLAAFGLSACFFCLIALSDGKNWCFYLASGLWTAGSLCTLTTLPPDREKPESKEET